MAKTPEEMSPEEARAEIARVKAIPSQTLLPLIQAGYNAYIAANTANSDTPLTDRPGMLLKLQFAKLFDPATGGPDKAERDAKQQTLDGLAAGNASSEYNGNGALFLNGKEIDAGTAAGLDYRIFITLTTGPSTAYLNRLQAVADRGAPQNTVRPQVAAAPIVQRNAIIPASPSPERDLQTALLPTADQTVERPQTPPLTRPDTTLSPPLQRVNTAAPLTAPPVRPNTPANAASPPMQLPRPTAQSTVLDLIVEGIKAAREGEAMLIKDVATKNLTEELTKTNPELANNPQAMNAAIQQRLTPTIRNIVLELSKDKATQKQIADGFLNAMRAQSPGAEQSGFYQNLKRLSSDERTFSQFLNTNLLDGVSRDYEQRVRAENGGKVPATIMDAVANNIMRVKPEIKQYNDRVGQDICDFVRNPETSRQRLLHSPATQRDIRNGVAQFRREHPFQTFFADLIGTNMHAEGEKRALAEMQKRGLRDRNYSREIQSGFINEFNKRAEKEMTGDQLANVRAFTRHLSQLPYSRFIQEDIMPRRMSAIILGIERPGEAHTPTRHIIPQQLISRNQNPYVNVAAAPTPPPAEQTQPRQAPLRPAPTSAA